MKYANIVHTKDARSTAQQNMGMGQNKGVFQWFRMLLEAMRGRMDEWRTGEGLEGSAG